MNQEGPWRLDALYVLASILTLGLLQPLAAAGQPIRVGGEFQVSTYTNAQQKLPAVAALGGGFVVAWEGYAQDGHAFGIFAQRFSNAGTALANEFQVNIYTTSNQTRVAIEPAAGGSFIVSWNSVQDSDNSYGVFARRFSSSGVALTGELQLNTFTQGSQRSPSVASGPEGGSLVVWQSFLQDGSHFGVFARVVSSSGVALGTETQVNTYITGMQGYPVAAATTGDEFVVAWQSQDQDGSSYGVFARRLSSAGVALASEFQVNTHTTNYQLQPMLAASSPGDFVIAWTSNDQDGFSSPGVFAQRFSSAGLPLGSEFLVTQRTHDIQRVTSVRAAPDHGFVVAWMDNEQSASGYDTFVRRFSSEGLPLEAEFQVNTYTTGRQASPVVAAVNDTDFVVAWDSADQDGYNTGVFAQRLRTPAILDVDGNGDVDALTDSLLILRYTFGFTGAVLTSNAIGNGCTRCDAAAIQAYLMTVD